MTNVPPASTAIPRSPASAAGRHRPRPDGREIGAIDLSGLLDLDQYAAGSGAPQSGAARQHIVRTLGGLEGEHDTLLNDDRLAHVQRSDPARHLDTAFDVVPRQRIRLDRAVGPEIRQGIGKQVMGCENAIPFCLLKLADQRRKNAVVAGHGDARSGQELGGPGVGSKIVKRGPADGSGENDFVHVFAAQDRKRLAAGPEADPGVRCMADGGRVGLVLERDHEEGTAGLTARVDDSDRKLAAAGEDAELMRHHPAAAGRRPATNRHG